MGFKRFYIVEVDDSETNIYKAEGIRKLEPFSYMYEEPSFSWEFYTNTKCMRTIPTLFSHIDEAELNDSFTKYILEGIEK